MGSKLSAWSFVLLASLCAAPSVSAVTSTRLTVPVGNNIAILDQTFNGQHRQIGIVSDSLASTKVILTQEGISQTTPQYYPYGQAQKEATNNPNDRYYTGQRKVSDDDSLYNYNARYYSPETGVFTQPDTVEGPNRFAYVKGNPIMRNDPSGKTCNSGIFQGVVGCNEYQIPEPIVEDLAPEYWHRLGQATIMAIALKDQVQKDGTVVPSYRWYGSAVNIAPGQALTNNHVVSAMEGRQPEIGHPEAKIGINNISWLTVELSWKSSKNDIALMSYNYEKYGGGFGTVPMAKQMPKVGDAIFGLGYADYTLNLKGKNEIKPLRGRVLGYDRNGDMIYGFGGYIDNHREDIPTSFGGRSGSGLVDIHGDLVGIHYASSASLKTQLSRYKENLYNDMETIKKTVHYYGFSEQYIEGFGRAVPMSEYIKQR